MATWHGNPIKIKVEFLDKNPYSWDPSYDDVEFKWEYSTSSDCLELIATHPNMKNGKNSQMLGPDWAKAHLYLLADWFATYNSLEELTDLLEPIFKKD